MRVLITGAAGMIGQALLRRLSVLDSLVVDVIDRRPTPTGLHASRYYRGDLARTSILEDLDQSYQLVIHLAGDIDDCEGPDCFTTNVYGTFVVAQKASSWAGARVIYASTTAVYGGGAGIVGETSIRKPPNVYATTKLLGEEVLRATGIPHTIIRFTYLYGGQGDQSQIARLVREAVSAHSIQVRAEERDSLHVSDAVEALVAAVHYTGPHTVFNCASGRRTSMEEVAQLALRCTGRRSSIAVEGQRTNPTIDISLIRREFGWSPRITLEEGISDMVEAARGMRPEGLGEFEQR